MTLSSAVPGPYDKKNDFSDIQISPKKIIPVVMTMITRMIAPIFAWLLELIPDGVTSCPLACSSSR
jgi:hypothetical protein